MASYTLSTPSVLVEGGHNAFPGAARLTSGRIVIVYRSGSAHVGGTDGVIKKMHSDDQGITWSFPVTVLVKSGIDLRDPALARLNDGRLAMTLFTYDSTWLDAHVSYSSDGGATWTTPVELPFPFTDWSACSGPIAETSPGVLWAFAYGQNIGDTFDSVAAVTSTDNGATWASAGILLDGQADSRHYQEPFAGKLPGGRIMVDVRSDTDATRRRLIREASGAWSAPTVVSTGVSGRPAWLRSSQGHIILGDRASSGVKRGRIAVQDDETAPLSAWVNLISTTEYLGAYQQMVELDDGVIGVAFCYERNDRTDSVLAWSTYTPDTYSPPPRRGASVAFL